MNERNIIISIIFIFVISINCYPQSVKKNIIEIGYQATYFYDVRGFQIDHFSFVNHSFAYLRSNNEFESSWQIRMNQFRSDKRADEYIKMKILNTSYLEYYKYILLLYNYRILPSNWHNINIVSGLTYRWGAENYFYDITYTDIHALDRISNDFAFAGGLRFEVKLSIDFHLYIQPVYNIYFYRQDKEFLKYDIIGNAGIGYKFGSKKK